MADDGDGVIERGPHSRLEVESPRGQGTAQGAEVTQADGGRWGGGRSWGAAEVAVQGINMS